MTTIACSRREMACDSRSSFENGEYLTSDDKIERIGDSLVGCAGTWPAIFKFLAWFRDQTRDRPDFSGDDDDFTAVVLNKKGIFVYDGSTYPCKVSDPFFVTGSGSMAARAAMLCGKSPAEAIAIAIKCDKNSGHPVRSFSLLEGDAKHGRSQKQRGRRGR